MYLLGSPIYSGTLPGLVVAHQCIFLFRAEILRVVTGPLKIILAADGYYSNNGGEKTQCPEIIVVDAKK